MTCFTKRPGTSFTLCALARPAREVMKWHFQDRHQPPPEDANVAPGSRIGFADPVRESEFGSKRPARGARPAPVEPTRRPVPERSASVFGRHRDCPDCSPLAPWLLGDIPSAA